MRFRFLIILFLSFMWLMSGCEKIELPSADEDENAEVLPPTLPEEDADVLNVSQALMAAVDDYIVVQGYIVGYVDGTSISEKNVVLGLPTDKPNTNMLIADSPDETNLSLMMPIGLPESYGGMQIRDDLNLFENPSLLHSEVRIQGFVTTYFRRMGIKKPSAYWVVKLEEGEVPLPSPADTLDTPGISHEESLIEGGR